MRGPPPAGEEPGDKCVDSSGAAMPAAMPPAAEPFGCLTTGPGDPALAEAPGEAAPDLGESVDNYYNPLIRLITGMEKPVICAVNGVAAGAGANIALACDIVIAARSASFIESFAKLGLIPDSGGTWHLPRLVGMARAKGLGPLREAARL